MDESPGWPESSRAPECLTPPICPSTTQESPFGVTYDYRALGAEGQRPCCGCSPRARAQLLSGRLLLSPALRPCLEIPAHKEPVCQASRGVVQPGVVSFQFWVPGESLTIAAHEEAVFRKFRPSFYSLCNPM